MEEMLPEIALGDIIKMDRQRCRNQYQSNRRDRSRTPYHQDQNLKYSAAARKLARHGSVVSVLPISPKFPPKKQFTNPPFKQNKKQSKVQLLLNIDPISLSETTDSTIQNRLNYYKDCFEFQNFFKNQMKKFSSQNTLNKDKLWGNWIMTCMNMQKDKNYQPLPSLQIAKNNKIFIKQMLLKQCPSEKEAIDIYDAILEKLQDIHSKYTSTLESYNDTSVQYVLSDLVIVNNQKNIEEFDNTQCVEIKINKKIYLNLVKKYNGPLGLKNYMVFDTLFNYKYIGITSYHQISIPPEVMETLKSNEFTVEVFAAPFNTTLEKYYSLFENDKNFGSYGKYQDMVDNHSLEGLVQANPPFEEGIFEQSSNIFLQQLDFQESLNKDLLILYFIPWEDSLGYQLLESSEFVVKKVQLQKEKYNVYDYINEIYIKGICNLFMFVLATSSSRGKWTESLEEQIVQKFFQREKKSHLPQMNLQRDERSLSSRD